MTTIRTMALSLVAALALIPATARAHHVVWLDFSAFDLSAYPTVNGNTPPSANDVSLVREEIVTSLVRDYAPFDVYFTEVQPGYGRFTQLKFLNNNYAVGNTQCLGCGGPNCGVCPCLVSTCTGIGSWDDDLSVGEVYGGSFAGTATGVNATTAPIATGIANTAAHELGHILSLDHCDGNDNFRGSGGFQGINNCNFTTDQNTISPIMANAQSGITMTQRTTIDRFFSIHSSRRMLNDQVQSHDHWALLQDTTGDGLRDLPYACIADYDTVVWFNRENLGTGFSRAEEWNDDAGRAPHVFQIGDVDGDGDADLLNGEIIDALTVKWHLRRSDGASFGPADLISSDAGSVGDLFRLADVDGDGLADLVHGRPQGTGDNDGMDWLVNFFDGVNFGASQTFATNLGPQEGVFLLGDVDADGLSDLVEVIRDSGGATALVARSTGTSFLAAHVDYVALGARPDHVMLRDADGDGDADLIFGTVLSDTDVDWDVAEANASNCALSFGSPCFSSFALWQTNGGNAGDFFRVSDLDGDGAKDLVFGRMTGEDDLTGTPDTTILPWYGRLSTGTAFGTLETWASDAGGEGFLFP